MPSTRLRLPYPDPDLTGRRVRLRRWSADDIGCIQETMEDPRLAEGTSLPVQATPAEAVAFLERQWSRQETGEGLSLAIAEVSTGRARGLIYLGSRLRSGTLSLGYWIVPAARRQGLTGEAVGLVSRWALTTGAAARVEALIEPWNIASQRTVEHNGFQLEGQLRSYLVFPTRRADALSYSLIEADLYGLRDLN